MKKLVSELNQVFDDWKTPKTSVPKQNLSKVTPPDHDRVFLLDRPGSLQSTIIAGVVAPSGKASNHLAIDTMNATFGGTFTSRLNMDLRESKHWAYGAHSMVLGPVGPGMFLMLAPVQTDKTAPSIKAMVKQAKAIAGPKPPTTEEIAKVKAQRIHSLPGQYQTNGAALQALQRIALYDRPDDYVARLKSRIEDISNDAVEKAAKEVVQPGHLTWVIVGDLDKIGKSVRDLDLGPVQVLDKDGKPVDED
jgi:predicted Zn-dependent peptidase